MLTEIFMPKMSNTMTEGRIMKWFKKENDYVKTGEIIVEIMTDKINREIEVTESGYLRKIIKEESNDNIKIGEVIGILTDTLVEKIPDKYLANSESEKKSKLKLTPKARKLAEELGIDINLIQIDKDIIKENDIRVIAEQKINATPLATKIAQDKNISLDKIKGTGIRGKIVKNDVEDFITKDSKQIKDEIVYSCEPITGVRSIIAERMTKSMFSAPHVYFFKEVNMEKCISLIETLNNRLKADNVKISITDLITLSVIKSLKRHPNLNICIEDNNIKKYLNINISLAVDTDRGLVVPVILKADKYSLTELSINIKKTITKARANELSPDELNGGSFTISNLGPNDSDSFTAIINNPQGAILAVSSIKKRPVVVEDTICIKPIMNITLTVDHRAIDGVAATKFINEIRDFLENPEMLML